MNQTHTSGPWRAIFHREIKKWKVETKNRVICDGFGEDQEEEANAVLISCAPDMLRILQDTAKADNVSSELLIRVQSMITKATNSKPPTPCTTTLPLSEVLALAYLPALIGSKRGKMQDALDAHSLAMLPELVSALEELVNGEQTQVNYEYARAILAKANQVPMP